jgi:hypothetical protein
MGEFGVADRRSMSKKMKSIVAFFVLFTLLSASYAADREASKLDELSSAKLGDYTLKFDTDQPGKAPISDPSGLTPLRRETAKPFVGFSFSRPLPDNFWDSAH